MLSGPWPARGSGSCRGRTCSATFDQNSGVIPQRSVSVSRANRRFGQHDPIAGQRHIRWIFRQGYWDPVNGEERSGPQAERPEDWGRARRRPFVCDRAAAGWTDAAARPVVTLIRRKVGGMLPPSATLDVRRLAALDMHGARGTRRRRWVILGEFALGTVGSAALGVWALTWGGAVGVIFGIWLLGLAANYLPLTVHVLALWRQPALDGELAGVQLACGTPQLHPRTGLGPRAFLGRGARSCAGAPNGLRLPRFSYLRPA